ILGGPAPYYSCECYHDGGCQGEWPVNPDCVEYVETSSWVFTGSPSGMTVVEECAHGVSSVSLSSGDPNAPAFTEGHVYSVSRGQSFDLELEYSAPWGTGADDVTVPSFFATIEIGEKDQSDPNVSEIFVTSFSAKVSNFASIVLGGEETGLNHFVLEPLKDTDQNRGYLNTSTGDFWASLRLWMTNSYFGAEDPAAVTVIAVGNIDPQTGSAAVYYEAGSWVPCWEDCDT
ncbi:MAG: hypothetical protein R3284_08905, partial [Rubricoccaceae bacterium]|nr:hypothetical protein [Rubricoccaceae bacterium]